MTTTLATPGPASKESSNNDVSAIVLRGVTWAVYKQLRQQPENDAISMTYANGELVLMSPSRTHERISTLIGMFIATWIAARGVEADILGTADVQDDALEIGLQPDGSFYFFAASPENSEELDDETPPTLAVEVDISSRSQPKLLLYAKLGVPEVWIWRNGLTVLVLREGDYVAAPESIALPGFPIGPVAELLREVGKTRASTLLTRFNKLIGPQT